mmetsp:Transcript_20660/g.43993  ORF Transcript_20660/g.43993 Transcript_20660/m.43993 type:complete len:211 (+) Transcript_20660:1270-1902(+)
MHTQEKRAQEVSDEEQRRVDWKRIPRQHQATVLSEPLESHSQHVPQRAKALPRTLLASYADETVAAEFGKVAFGFAAWRGRPMLLVIVRCHRRLLSDGTYPIIVVIGAGFCLACPWGVEDIVNEYKREELRLWHQTTLLPHQVLPSIVILVSARIQFDVLHHVVIAGLALCGGETNAKPAYPREKLYQSTTRRLRAYVKKDARGPRFGRC